MDTCNVKRMPASFTRQILTLLAVVLLFSILSVVTLMVLNRPGVDAWRMSVVMCVIQNVGIFIIPALITARIYNNGRTLHVLALDRLPRVLHLCMMLAIYVASMPMMNALVTWNEGIELPAALSGIETWMRSQEAAAQQATELLLGVTSVGGLIVIIAVIGVLTGIAEELMFRGSVQRLLTERRVNVHVAIWLTAFIFSALHFQFYGFVPRMLLGAFFGYLLVCSGSLWLPILAHALNNSLAAVSSYVPVIEEMPWIGTYTPVMVAASSVATLLLLWYYVRYMRADVQRAGVSGI